MRFYNVIHKHYCGIDLHARNMYICVMDQAGTTLFHRDLPTDPSVFLKAIAPFRENLVVAVECIFTWYWLADLCAREGIDFVLGHALYMKAIHGGKAKNDLIDSLKIATLLRGGMLPQSYVYPPEMRSTRDLLRRRLTLVRQRGHLLAHIQNTHHQYNLPTPKARIHYRCNREGIAEKFSDPSVHQSVSSDIELAGHYDSLIKDLELFLTQKSQSARRRQLLPSALHSRSGKNPRHDHALRNSPDRALRTRPELRFLRSTGEMREESSGKRLGTGGAKVGNVHLKWAFSEAAVLFLRANPPAQKFVEKLRKKHGKAKALSILAHKLGRAVFFIMKHKRPFSLEAFRIA